MKTTNRPKNDYEKQSFISKLKYFGIWLLVLIIVSVIASLILIFITHGKTENVYYYIFHEIGKGIFITALITGTIKLYITRQYTKQIEEADDIRKNYVTEKLELLQSNVLDQTNRISKFAYSLNAMQEVDLVRLYKNRNEASEDIKKTIESTLKSEDPRIRIIGISLNDFTRDDNSALYQAWKHMYDYIKNKKNINYNQKEADIKLLVINPDSMGAFLRAGAENTKDYNATRLFRDVETALMNFENLYKEFANKNLSFQAKVYNTSPILYLVWTPNAAFVQQYFFRPRHQMNINIPVQKYVNLRKDNSEVSSIHEELEFHFDWIWQKSSFSVTEFLTEKKHGNDLALRESNIKNIYYDFKNLNQNRILFLIKNAKERLWLKGISLHSFFRKGSPLYNAIWNACKQDKLDIRILVIDPDCPQATIRSFKEFNLIDKTVKYEYFKDNNELIRSGDLFQDTTKSIEQIQRLKTDIKNKKCNIEFEAKKYFSAPEAFMLFADDIVMVEQYHYGKIPLKDADESDSRILGGDVPVFEYSKKSYSKKENDELKYPYRIFEDHYKFVFNNFTNEI